MVVWPCLKKSSAAVIAAASATSADRASSRARIDDVCMHCTTTNVIQIAVTFTKHVWIPGKRAVERAGILVSRFETVNYGYFWR